jgi:hypothetical protein
MQKVYYTVVYFLGDQRAKGSNPLAKAWIDTSYKTVSNTIQQIESTINELTECNRELNLNTKLASISGANPTDVARELNSNLIRDEKQTAELMKGAIYGVVKYVALRDVKL